MQFLFLDDTGQTLFFRNDAISATWTQEELHLDADFPYDENKIIRNGQRIAFLWEGQWQVFEIRSAKEIEPSHFQQVVAESLAVAELTDEHIDQAQYDNISASTAIERALNGTLWQVGENTTSVVSSADIARGSVWQAVNNIRSNWNVYIEPRYTLNSSGQIGRYLDIFPAGGTFKGLRLSVDKNLNDPSVTWDDSNVITSIKGYGATIHDSEDESHVLTFADAVWEETADHPAKPAGSEWLTDPEANAEFARNGRPRRGFYQNTSIEDPYILLQKSWESLKAQKNPDIQIEGTVTDLRRLGYTDEPIMLHDMVLVEVKPTGLRMMREIIRLTVDLLDPAQTIPTIGSYIPNIIYINRDTAEKATGSRGGGGRGSGQTDKEEDFYTNINANKYAIQLEAGYRHEGDVKLHSEIVITASEIRMEVEDVDSQLRSVISQTATQIRAEVANTASGLYSAITITASEIRSEVAATDSSLSSSIVQTASQIRSEVTASNSEIYSTIEQTATQIRSEVAATDSSLSSSITQTASQIRSEVTASNSTIYSTIEQTATQIRTEVASTTSNLSSSITQNADRIGLVVTQKDGQDVVDAASIVAGINGQTGSYVKIQAKTINLDGYVTVSELSATDAKITNLESGYTTASWLKASSMSAGTLYLGGNYVQHGTLKAVTSVDFANETVTTEEIHFLKNT